jgi:Predicted esterase of the alpha-beta hydrolase superfamily
MAAFYTIYNRKNWKWGEDMSQSNFDFDKEYGIVLEGGGAKGAYQIGVWKALVEFGVKIKAVAGVSVGALNGALICMGDYERAVELWKNISYSSIMSVDDDEMDKLVRGRFKEINLQTVSKQSKKFLVGGGIDVTPLRQLMDDHLDEKRIRESEIEFFMGTFNLSNLKELEIAARDAEEGCLKDYLMASANFPLFKNEKLKGKLYLDGGLANNVPIDMLINRGYKNIIVIRIYGIGVEKKIKIPEDVNITYIAPKVHLCNVLEFNRKKAIRNITLGYYDAVRLLKPLAGNDYYIESSKVEKDYLETFLNLPEEVLKELATSNKPENLTGMSVLRKCIEEVFPQLSYAFKLGKSWRYENLYYAILEHAARKLRIPKYKIYSELELCNLINKNYKEKYTEEKSQDSLLELSISLINE